MEFKYKLIYLIYSDTYEHALFGVWWGPHFSENVMQSYIFNNLHITNVYDKTGTSTKRSQERNITCSIFVHILVAMLMPHKKKTIEHVFFLSSCQGLHFSGNFIQSHTLNIYSHTLLTAKRLTSFYQ